MNGHSPTIPSRAMQLVFFFSAVLLACGATAIASANPPVQAHGSYLVASAENADDGAATDDDFAFLEEEYQDDSAADVKDPLATWNRAMFQINDRLYFWLLKPAAKAYGYAVPQPARKGIKNFFHNVKAPIRIVNCALQGKGRSAMAAYAGFIINTTAGFLGFADVAKNHAGLDPGEEDLGQTFGRYGIGNGIYLVWPFIGPSTLRDTVGMVGDTVFLDPVSYVSPRSLRIGLNAEETINNTSLRIGDYESLKEASIQPYEAFKNAYIQHRKGLVDE